MTRKMLMRKFNKLFFTDGYDILSKQTKNFQDLLEKKMIRLFSLKFSL